MSIDYKIVDVDWVEFITKERDADAVIALVSHRYEFISHSRLI